MIGIIGGTGPQGQGLALRLAAAGESILLGSRSTEKATTLAAELGTMLEGTGAQIAGSDNVTVVNRCRTLLVCLPYDGLAATLSPFAGHVDGHLVLSVANPLSFAGGGPRSIAVPEGSAAEQVAAILPGATVTTAFNNLSAVNLRNIAHDFAEDVLVCGDDEMAVRQTVELVERIDGLRGVAVGPLRHAATVEGLTAVLIEINRANKITAGVRIVGLDD